MPPSNRYADVQDGSIVAKKLGTGAVIRSKIAAKAVGTAELDDGSVTPVKLSFDIDSITSDVATAQATADAALAAAAAAEADGEQGITDAAAALAAANAAQADIDGHEANTSNPHAVTASQAGALADTLKQASLTVLTTNQALGTTQPLSLADTLFSGKTPGGSVSGNGVVGIVSVEFSASGPETGTAGGQAGLGAAAASDRPYPSGSFGGQRGIAASLFKLDGDDLTIGNILASPPQAADINARVYGYLSRRSDLGPDLRWRLWFYYRRASDGLEVAVTPTINVTGVTIVAPEVFLVKDLPVRHGLNAPTVASQAAAEVGPKSIGAAELGDGVVTDTQVAAANKDGTTGTPSMRTLGSGAQQAAAGNDSRFPVAGEKAALAGTNGTPGSGNKYVTDSDPRNANARTPTNHAGNHATGQPDAISPSSIGAIAAPATPAQGDLLQYDGANWSRLLPGTNGLFLMSKGAATLLQWSVPLALALFGLASDGNFTLDGAATPAWATRNGNVYTMTRDAYLQLLTVNTGITLECNGFVPFATSCVNAGFIQVSSPNASGGTGATAASSAGSLSTSGGNGGNGTSGVGAGGGGANVNGSLGGNGGAGGQADGGNLGGASGQANAPAATAGDVQDIGVFLRRRLLGNNVPINGGGGGGGGGANAGGGTAQGGGGGAGCPALMACFGSYDGTGGVIQTKGGNGANGTFTGAGKAGGGGGGGAGPILLLIGKLIALGTVQTLGGAFGNGANGGANGSAGNVGKVTQIILAQ